jgi:hypothetical protein
MVTMDVKQIRDTMDSSVYFEYSDQLLQDAIQDVFPTVVFSEGKWNLVPEETWIPLQGLLNVIEECKSSQDLDLQILSCSVSLFSKSNHNCSGKEQS